MLPYTQLAYTEGELEQYKKAAWVREPRTELNHPDLDVFECMASPPDSRSDDWPAVPNNE